MASTAEMPLETPPQPQPEKSEPAVREKWNSHSLARALDRRCGCGIAPDRNDAWVSGSVALKPSPVMPLRSVTPHPTVPRQDMPHNILLGRPRSVVGGS
jgi:hypothetical protein